MEVKRALCDPDPSVMSASLHVVHRLAKNNTSLHKDLVPSLVSVLKQAPGPRLLRASRSVFEGDQGALLSFTI